MSANLPCIGIWNHTKTVPPTAGNTLVGLWVNGGQRIEFFCAFYWDGNSCVDPDEFVWTRITYHSRQGASNAAADETVDPPDYWADCRFLIPARGGE